MKLHHKPEGLTLYTCCGSPRGNANIPSIDTGSLGNYCFYKELYLRTKYSRSEFCRALNRAEAIMCIKTRQLPNNVISTFHSNHLLNGNAIPRKEENLEHWKGKYVLNDGTKTHYNFESITVYSPKKNKQGQKHDSNKQVTIMLLGDMQKKTVHTLTCLSSEKGARLRSNSTKKDFVIGLMRSGCYRGTNEEIHAYNTCGNWTETFTLINGMKIKHTPSNITIYSETDPTKKITSKNGRISEKLIDNIYFTDFLFLFVKSSRFEFASELKQVGAITEDVFLQEDVFVHEDVFTQEDVFVQEDDPSFSYATHKRILSSEEETTFSSYITPFINTSSVTFSDKYITPENKKTDAKMESTASIITENMENNSSEKEIKKKNSKMSNFFLSLFSGKIISFNFFHNKVHVNIEKNNHNI